MGLRDIFKKAIGNLETEAQNNENMGKVVSEKAAGILKTLSGEGLGDQQRVVDNIIILTGASGGTGTSTLVANLAYTMATRDLRVLVIDLNIMYPAQHNYFGVEQKIEGADLVSFLLGQNELGESIEIVRNKISLMYANNRNLVDSLNTEADAPVNNFISALERIRTLFDVVLIDAPMHIEHTLVNHAFYSADQIYLVWDEGINSISNTDRIRRNMGVSGIEAYSKMRVILNKRTSIRYRQYPFEKLNIELAEFLPFSLDIIESGLKSEIFCEKGSTNDKIANEFFFRIGNLADELVKKGGLVGGQN